MLPVSFMVDIFSGELNTLQWHQKWHNVTLLGAPCSVAAFLLMPDKSKGVLG